jgi:hypothetical protein
VRQRDVRGGGSGGGATAQRLRRRQIGGGGNLMEVLWRRQRGGGGGSLATAAARRWRRLQEVREVMWDEWGKLWGRQKWVKCVKIKGWKLTCLLENAAWSSPWLEIIE